MVKRAKLRESRDEGDPQEERDSQKWLTNSKLTEKLIEDFCTLIVRGLPADGVCDYLGISPTTYWTWMKKGERCVNGGGTPKAWRIYAEFYLRFKRAAAEWRLNKIDRLENSMHNLWVRDLAVLERRDKKNFSRAEPRGGSMEDFDPDAKFM